MSEYASKLVEWYWEFGAKRGGAHRVISQWLIKAYKCRSREFSHKHDTDRFRVAVWGPSQAGKSTLLSNYIDHKSEPRSALMWDDNPFVFSETEQARNRLARGEFGWAFNPFNGGNDASACVTRFYAADQVEHVAFPVRLHFANRREILHSLAAGYLSECKLEVPGLPERVWTIETLRALLPQDGGGERDREATELLMDAIYVVDRMIAELNTRYSQLIESTKNLIASGNVEDTEWGVHVRDEIISNPVLCSNFKHAMDFVTVLLWDGKPTLTSFLNELLVARKQIDAKFGASSVFCSLPATALFVDMDAYRLHQNIGNPNAEKKAYVEKTVKQLGFAEEGGHALIGATLASSPLLSGELTFGHFQALIWEVEVPLNRRFLTESAPDVAAFMDKAELLDIPGVANEQSADKEAKVDLATCPPSDLFLKIMKRGKTASIVNRFADDGRIDQIMLLVRSDRHPSRPDQLATGIKMIWQEWNPDYEVASKKPPPAAITLNLTFFNTIVDMVAQGGIGADLSVISQRLANLGPIVDPDVCRTFVTSYPAFVEGRLRHSPEELQAVPAHMERSDWVARRFPRRAERNSITAMLESAHVGGDGAVTYLLKQLGAGLDFDDRQKNVERRQQQQRAGLLDLLAAIAPDQNQNAERARDLIGKMLTTLQDELNGLPATRLGKRRLTEISEALRRSFSFVPEELRALPSARDEIKDHVDTEISSWIENSERARAMATLGISQIDRLPVLEAISRIIDRRAVASSLAQILAKNANPGRDLLKHAKRFVATVFNSQIRGGQAYFDKQPRILSDRDLVIYCNDNFAKWIDPHSKATDTPHFQMVVSPMLQRLEELRGQIGAGTREPQIGDDYVRKMLQELTAAGGPDDGAPAHGGAEQAAADTGASAA